MFNIKPDPCKAALANRQWCHWGDLFGLLNNPVRKGQVIYRKNSSGCINYIHIPQIYSKLTSPALPDASSIAQYYFVSLTATYWLAKPCGLSLQ